MACLSGNLALRNRHHPVRVELGEEGRARRMIIAYGLFFLLLAGLVWAAGDEEE